LELYLFDRDLIKAAVQYAQERAALAEKDPNFPVRPERQFRITLA
jgi:hypothetical protein